MKKGLFAAMAVLTIFAMIGCDNGSTTKEPADGKVTISFNLDGGTYDDDEAIPAVEINKGASLGGAYPIADLMAKDGFVFDGWKVGTTTVSSTTTFQNSATLVAQWKPLLGENEILITFDPNGGECSVTSKIIEIGDAIGELPVATRDDFEFTGWYGDAVDMNALMVEETDTYEVSVTLFARWKVIELPVEDLDLVGAERIVITNGGFAMYRFNLPAGATWADYSGLTVDYMISAAATLKEANSCRTLALNGPIPEENFQLGVTDGNNLAIAPFGAENTEFRFSVLASWTTIAAYTNSIGINAEAGEWFTIPYKIDGTGKSNNYSHQPEFEDEGPFYFGIGISMASPAGQYIRNVKLVSYDGDVDVEGVPLYFEFKGEAYPAFHTYTTFNGQNGVSDLYRAMADGSIPEPVVIPEEITVSFDLNYESAPAAPASETIDNRSTLGSQLPADPDREDFTFLGWFDAAEGGNKVIETTVLYKDQTLYAQWAPEGIIVTFALPELGSGTGTALAAVPDFLVLAEDEEIGSRIPADKNFNGFTFLGWFDGEDIAEETSSWTEDVTLTAKFEVIAPVSANKVGFTYIDTIAVPTDNLAGKGTVSGDDFNLVVGLEAGSYLRVYAANNRGADSTGWGSYRFGITSGPTASQSIQYNAKAGNEYFFDVDVDQIITDIGESATSFGIDAYNGQYILMIELWEYAGPITWTSLGMVTLGNTDGVPGKGDLGSLSNILSMGEGSYLELTVNISSSTGQPGWGVGTIGTWSSGTSLAITWPSSVPQSAGSFVQKIDLWELLTKMGDFAPTSIVINPMNGADIISCELFSID